MSLAPSDATPPDLRLVYEPIIVGDVEVPNRVVRTAHFTKMSTTGALNDDLVEYHSARARGGVGLTILEATAVHPSSILGATTFAPDAVEWYQRLMRAVEPHGMKVFVQLWHGGHHYGVGGVPARSASDTPSPVNTAPPVPLSVEELAEITAAFATGAARAIEGGLHGVEVHGGHSYLFHQFLSPLTNHRDDEYGGSLDNRMRFLVDTLRAVRAAIGAGPPVGVRLSAGQVPGDLGEDEVAAVARRLLDLRLIDFLDASIGTYYATHWTIAGMERPTGYQLPSSGQITAAVPEVPRIVAGRFRTLADAEAVLRSGQADLVSMVRAHIADPDLVRKTRAGRADEVRPCIGCNQGCLARTSGVDLRLGCVVNPAIGREASLSEDLIGRTSRPRRVVVVGGGPAGLEAARTAALRGHDVVLLEARDELGGTARVAARAPHLDGVADIVEWLGHEVCRLGVDVRTAICAEVETIDALEPDIIVIATGAPADRSGIMTMTPGEPVTGTDLPHVLVSTQLLERDPSTLGRSAFVYDDVGQYEAVAVTEHLLIHGCDVTVATRHSMFAPAADASHRLGAALDRFGHHDGRLQALMVRAQLRSIGPGAVRVRPAGRADDVEVAADTVVLVTHRRGGDVLSTALRERGHEVVVVGDALSGRDLQAAMREGHVAGRSIA